MKVYFIPGIGADYRIFQHLRLPAGYEAHYIHWIAPYKKEKLGDYALRLTQQINLGEPFILAGVSLGGIMAIEITKRIPPASIIPPPANNIPPVNSIPPVSTILISSIPLSTQLPGWYRGIGALHLERLIPMTLVKLGAVITHTLTMKQAADRRLMRRVDWSGDNGHIRWALRAVLDWRNDTLPKPLFHLHGTRDVVFPIHLTHPTHSLPKGGHFFVVSRPEAVNQFLREVLPPIPASTLPAPNLSKT